MSAIDREIDSKCLRCGVPTTTRYDRDGQAVHYDRKSPVSLVEHVCVQGQDQRVGERRVQTK